MSSVEVEEEDVFVVVEVELGVEVEVLAEEDELEVDGVLVPVEVLEVSQALVEDIVVVRL